MVTEFVAGSLVVCVVCYAVHRYRKRTKWAGIREEQLKKLEQLKRLKWLKGKIG